MYVMLCSLFLVLFANTCIGSCNCCAVGQIARSSPGGLERHNYLEPRIRRPYTHEKHGVFSVQDGNRVRRSPRARRLAFRLPLYDTLRVASRNGAGGVCEQAKTALRKSINTVKVTKYHSNVI